MTGRIVVALDAATPDVRILDALDTLGALRGGALLALLLEDEGLDRLADLPGVREIRLAPSPVQRPLEAGALRRDLLARQQRLRTACARTAERLGMDLEVEVVRSDVVRELTRVAAGADLMLLTRSAVPRTVAASRTASARFGDAGAAGPELLFVNAPWASGRCVLVVVSADEAGSRARTRAAAIAERLAMPLEVVTIDAPAAAGSTETIELVRLCRRRAPRLLVLPASAGQRLAEQLAGLVADVSASVLLCRP